MDIEQVKARLRELGVSFPANMGEEKLRTKLAEAEAKAAEQGNPGGNPPEGGAPGPTPDSEPEGNSPGAAKGAAPAASPAPAPAEPAADAIPEGEIIAKMSAGLTRDQAVEVITNQRAHDKALAEG